MRGSKIIYTDRFPKTSTEGVRSWGDPEAGSPRKFLDFNSLKSPFLGFVVIQTGYWPDFNLEIVSLLQKI